MDGNPPSSSSSPTSNNINNNPSSLLFPPSTFRFARAARSPSVTLQRLPSSQSVNTAAARAAAVTQPTSATSHDSSRRNQAATVADPLSPTRERTEPPLSSPPLTGQSATTLNAEDLNDLEAQEQPRKKSSVMGLNMGGLFGGGGGAGRKRAATSANVDSAPSRRRLSVASHHSVGFSPTSGEQQQQQQQQQPADAAARERQSNYDQRVSDLLDVLDPEVQTLNNLGDIQNSLFIPYTGFFDRTRKIQLTKPPPRKESLNAARDADRLIEEETSSPTEETAVEKTTPSHSQGQGGEEKQLPAAPAPRPSHDEELDGIVPPTETHQEKVAEKKVVVGKYFVLPTSLVDMSDWTDQEKAELDDYVRHLLHSKKERLRRTARGFGKYVRTPLGAFVTIYASLLTFWGAAWVLFLIGWLSVGEQQDYYIEICDQILVALFCLVGLGLIPWRAVDSYHTWFIVKYHYRTLKLRKQRGLPPLEDENDLPNDRPFNQDLERAGHGEDAVLTDEEQQLFTKHQTALAKSHTYYRPHATATHHAFPMGTLMGIIILCDMHSTFQLALGSATWSISYHRDFKHILTTVILCFSLSSNITAGILISIGNRKTRKVEVVEALMRQAVTEEALRRKQDAEEYRAEKRAEKDREERAALKRRQSEDRRRAQGEGGAGPYSQIESFRDSADLPRTSSGKKFLQDATDKIRMSLDKERLPASSGRSSRDITRTNTREPKALKKLATNETDQSVTPDSTTNLTNHLQP